MYVTYYYTVITLVLLVGIQLLSICVCTEPLSYYYQYDIVQLLILISNFYLSIVNSHDI